MIFISLFHILATFEIYMILILIFWCYHDIVILSWYIKLSNTWTLSQILANIWDYDIYIAVFILSSSTLLKLCLKNALTQTQKAHKRILPFVTQFHPSLPCLKNILMEKWHLIQNPPLLREIYKDPPLISYRKGKSLKDILVKAKL